MWYTFCSLLNFSPPNPCKCRSRPRPCLHIFVISYHALHSISSAASRVDEAEDVVEDVVVAAVRQELEGLAIAHRPPLLLDKQSAADHDQDPAALVTGLRIDSCDLVLDSLEGEFLLHVLVL